MSPFSEVEDNLATEIDLHDTEAVSGGGWGGAVFGAFCGAEFGPVGMVVGAVAGGLLLD